MEKRELMFFNPVFKTMIWGGNKMRDEFGYKIPAENTGECWAVSAHPNGDCVCISGEYEGKTLSWLWDNHRKLFGNYEGDRFPLLLKVIDAKTDLSIQVHPSDDYAKVNENGSLGKTECWYILDCDPDSTIVVGHNAKTKEELCKLIDEHKFTDLIKEVKVEKGDFIQIDPGTVHAIKGGVMILETQQNSDITYRVYDYDRLQDGKPRQLHIDQSKDVITVPAKEGAVMKTTDTEGVSKLVSCNYYSVEKIIVKNSLVILNDSPFRIVSCIEGEGTVDGRVLKKGEHFVVPGGYGSLSFSGNMTLISSVPA